MNLNQIDLIVSDVKSSALLVSKLLNVDPDVLDDGFARVSIGATALMFSTTALIPMQRAEGVILHFETVDVELAAQNARANGVEILLGPVTTDWGTTSVLVQGPEGIVLDFYRNE
ncbi:VOC family protein [Cryobacterium sp. Sr3]|uniref:VOC family protein n=1 Tax=Cryobacterium sp. Sr3 TaxID=1259194 RepID=UPI003220A0A3